MAPTYNLPMPQDNPAFAKTFATLRKLFTPYAKTYPPIVDEPGRYFLATKVSKTKSGAPIWFGGVEIKKNYVSFHLIPIYMFPDLKKAMSRELQKRMQGKSCFNFKKPDATLFSELERLTAKAVEHFRKMDWSKLQK